MTETIVLDPSQVATGLAPAPPAVRAVGTVANGTGNVSPGLPAGTERDDILLMFCETNTGEVVTAPSGWAVAVSGFAAIQTTNSRLTVLWKRAVTGETAPTIADPGDHVVARIVGVSGCVASGDPFDGIGLGTEGTSDTSVSIPGGTTAVNNVLVFAAIATGTDVATTANVSGFANADLESVTERVDNWVTDGGGGGVGVGSGVKRNPGTYAATTATLANAAEKAMISFGLKPAVRAELDITGWVSSDGVDWGDAAIEAYMAEAARGQVPVDFRVPNRTIQVPLKIRPTDTHTFEQARAAIQAKVALFQREGGWLKRVTSVGPLYADVVNASLKLGGGWFQANRDFDTDAVMTLECVPDFYGDEIDLGDNVETSAAELIFTETGIKGDYPGRCRIVIDNDDGSNHQKGLIWGIRSRYYNAASTAALVYEAEALEPLSPAAIATQSGASGGGSNNIVQHASLGTAWARILSTNIGGSTFMTHEGTYRVWARVRSTTVGVEIRFLWAIGDLTSPTTNAAWAFPQVDEFFLADLGEIRLDPVSAGAHRWYGQVQAKGPSGATGNAQVDTIWFQPVAESAGRAQVPSIPAEEGIVDFIGPRSSGTLANNAAVGTVAWSNPSNAAADDGAYASATGSSVISNYLQATNFGFTVPGSATIKGIKVEVEKIDSGMGGVVDSSVRLVKAGTVQGANKALGTAWPSGLNIYTTYGGPTDLWSLAWTDSDINASNFGVVISGRTTINTTMWIDHIRITVYYTVSGWTPPTDTVIAASQSAELRWDGIVREDTTGTAFSPASYVVGDLPRVPPSGLEGRTAQFLVKASRGDLDTLPDSGIDDISARVWYRPSWLIVPTA